MPRAAHRSHRADVCLAKLAERFGDRFVTARPVLEAHGHGEGGHESHPPDAVVYAQTVEEIAFLLALCSDHLIPVVAFGAGTSLEGQVQATSGGVCLDLSRMNAVLEVNPDDLDCRVEAGVTREQLN